MRYYMEVFRDFFRELWQRFKNWMVRSWRSFRRTSHNFALLFPVLFLVMSILFSIFCFFRITGIPKTQYDQKAAASWSGDTNMKYRQLTVVGNWQKAAGGAAPLFLNGQSGMNVRSIEQIRQSLNTTLEVSMNALSKTNNAITRPQGGNSAAAGAEKSAKYWIDAYSTEALAKITKPVSDGDTTSKSPDVMVTAVGGDYFLIHGNLLRSGYFFSKIDYGSRPIILDEGLAFLLFSSSDVQGFEVEIAGVIFEVCGVIRKNPGKDNTSTYGDYPRAYIPFQEIAVLSAPSAPSETSGSESNTNDKKEKSLTIPATDKTAVDAPPETNGRESNINDVKENDQATPIFNKPADDAYSATFAVAVQKNTKEDNKSTCGDYLRVYSPFQEIDALSASSASPEASGSESHTNDVKEKDMTTPVSDMSGMDSYKDTYAVMYYEAVVPDRLSGMGIRFLKEAFSDSGADLDANFLLIENTGRFCLSQIWENYFPVGESELKSREYELPFYEFSARAAESRIFFWWVWLFIAILTGIINIIALYLRFVCERKKIRKKIRRADVKGFIEEIPYTKSSKKD